MYLHINLAYILVDVMNRNQVATVFSWREREALGTDSDELMGVVEEKLCTQA